MNARSSILAMSLLASSFAPALAEAALIRFCFTHTGSFTDNGFGEDRWATDPLDGRPALGQQTYVGRSGGQSLWTGNLTTDEADPGQGCTPQIDVASPNGDYSIFVGSYGVIAGYPVEVWDATQSGPPFRQVTWAPYSITDDGALGTYRIPLSLPTGTSAWNVFNVYLAVAYGVWRNSGPAPGSLYKVHVVPTGGGYGSGTGIIAINSGWAKRKFEILHETGHRTAYLATQGVMNGAQSYLWYDPACPRDLAGINNCDSNNPPEDNLEDGGYGGVTVPGDCSGDCLPTSCTPDHAMRSMEYVGSAVGEGFAHFFSAAAWNDPSVDADCFFRYYSPFVGLSSRTVDCESGATGLPRGYMRTTCDPDDFVSHGVELDWLRAFWDMRTNTNAFGAPPSFIEMITWLDHTPAWNKYTAFVNLDAQANQEGFRLDYAWDTAKAFGTTDGNGL